MRTSGVRRMDPRCLPRALRASGLVLAALLALAGARKLTPAG